MPGINNQRCISSAPVHLQCWKTWSCYRNARISSKPSSSTSCLECLSVLEHVKLRPEASPLQEQQYPFQMISTAFYLLCRVTWTLKQQGVQSCVMRLGMGLGAGGCGAGASGLQSCSRDSIGNAGVMGGGQEVCAGGGCDAEPLHILPERCKCKGGSCVTLCIL